MDAQKEVHASRCSFTAPVCSVRIKSWCNRWLACSTDEDQRASFGTALEASRFFLLSHGDGRYKLQLLSADFPKGSASSKSWFLCCRGDIVGCSQRHPECNSEDVLFSLELDETGRASLRRGSQGYLTCDWHGRLWGGTTRARKWEMFTLVEQALEATLKTAPWIVPAPVRVTLQTSTRKYLCAARHVVSANAEAPCCCEEFLLDLTFTSVPTTKCELATTKHSPKSSGFWQALLGKGEKKEEVDDVSERAGHCTIRTADGACLLSAEPDGNIFTTPVNCAQGREIFSIYLHSDRMISVRQATGEQRHLSVEFGHLVSRSSHRKFRDLFNLQLANGSRVLLRSVHGGFLGADTSRSRLYSNDKKDSVQGVGAWQLRSHGDSLYTLTSLSSTSKRGADLYMFVDATGHLYQSSDPAVHFPSAASLFEIKPASNAVIFPGASTNASISGFTIRTARRINGKQRYLTAEPTGSIRAVKLTPSRWELFQLVDLDATVATAAPGTYSSRSVAMNQELPQIYGPYFSPATSRTTAKTEYSRSTSRERSACEVAAMALLEGQAVPKKSSSSLQELCIAQVCFHASEMFKSENCPESRSETSLDEEFSELVSALCSLSRRHDLLPASMPPDLTDENAFSIPDDLLARIWDACRLRQVPKTSCKWMQSAFLPQTQAQGPRARNRIAGRSSSAEGWHCSSCNQGNVLPMDAAVNPAHHRYLDVQSRVYSRAIQSTGILWNIISLAGVSIMSTALFCQLKAAATRRSVAF